MIENLQQAFVKDDSMEWEVLNDMVKRKIMAYDPSLMLVKVYFKKGGIGPIHDHFHSQTSYVVSGAFEVTIDDKTTLLKKGDVFYIKPHAPHGAVCVEEGELLDFFSPVREDFL
ncbi:cupin domain-containing protein [Arcticibacterium luteifluviistationis]|uniref:Cupin domain-containing protein n=1 Tax=Arcticibacterium luteifluviistationis TaxID=1784714 RepID=A0A2Z4GB03_9BACT|nr:cupin domain-containing protein [Arcticibacterium luteifluviistationis]AWV98396.1 cupin domain-containing protein [Arcticibacterium luteifluviistationis]